MEQEKSTQVDRDIHEIKNSLTKLETRMYNLHQALTGNDITKDGGLIGRVIESEKELATLTFRIEAVEKKEGQRRLYIRILWSVAGAVLMYILTHIFNK